jgi:nicotinate-nucleotide adenylyltransferase
LEIIWDLDIGIWNFAGIVKKRMMLQETNEKGKGRRIGLFGGTFNPIHLGHLRGAEEIWQAFHLDEIIFIPSSVPPHKVTEKVAEAKHRLEMVRLAIASNPHFSSSDLELTRPGRSFSVDTLRHFRERHEDTFFFILGGEAFQEIETWKDFQILFSLCHFIVMVRTGSQKNNFSSPFPEALIQDFRYDPGERAWIHLSGHLVYFREIPSLDISSTRVRELIGKGDTAKYLIPAEVEAYIQNCGLYRKQP